jgi:hypothetical protein
VLDAARTPNLLCFKVPQDPCVIFVSECFAALALEHNLTGIGLMSPADTDPVAPRSPIAGFPTIRKALGRTATG